MAFNPDQPRDVAGKFGSINRDDMGPNIIEERDEDEDYAPQPRVYDMYADRLTEVQKRIAKANARLEKNGIEGRFEIETETYTETVKKGDENIEVERVKVTLNRPRISYNGFEFMARVEPLDNGEFIAYSAPGQEMNGYRPHSMDCEHCGVKRPRTKVYVVKEGDGSMKTIGGSCLQLYTGMSPQGLSALEFDELDEFEQYDSDWEDSPRGAAVVESDRILSLAYVLTKDSGYQNAHAENPTANDIRSILNPPLKQSEEYERWAREVREEASKVNVEDIRKEALEALEGNDSDWATNVRATLTTEHVRHRAIGTLASSMSAIHKARKKKAEVPYAEGFIGDKGQRVKGVKAKVRWIEVYDGEHGEVAKVTLQTEDGHKVFFRGSSASALDLERNDDVVFDATVKKQDTYEGVDSTMVARAKFTVQDED